MSYLPAYFGGALDRGFIREGAAADIVVYDLDGLKLLPTEVVHDFPGGEWRRVQRGGRVPLDYGERPGDIRGRKTNWGPTGQVLAPR